jgi:vitamin B12 transporter
VTATMAGFAPIASQPLEVAASNSQVDFTLQIASPKETVVVTATKTETPLAQLGSSVSVITGEELALKGTFSVADALRETAGVSIVQSGGIGKVSSLFLRGGNSDYTKILIDGIPVNEPGGSYNLANLSTASIDRIEIVRGPQSALYGSDAIAGVIQIFTKRGTSEDLSPKPSAMFEGGTFATYRFSGGITGSNSRMDYSASFSRFNTDNNVANGSFNETTFAGNLGLRISKKLEMRTVFRSEAGRSGTPGSWAFGRPDLDAYFRRRDEAGTVTLNYFQNPSWTHKFAYAVSDSMQFSADPLDSGSYTPQYKNLVAPFSSSDWPFQTLNQTRRQKINYQSDWILPFGHLVSAGADYERESGEIGDPTLSPIAVSRNNYSGFFQDQWAHRNRLFATAGVRLDHNENFGFFASPRLSLAMLARRPGSNSPIGTTKLKANFGLGIKEPSLTQSIINTPYTKGNPDLRPEKTISFDAGIEQHFNSGRGIIELTYFQNRFKDQIGYVMTDPNTWAGSYFNIGKSRARGLESSLSLDLFWKLAFSGTYTFLDSEVLESSSDADPVYAKGQELLRRPRHSGNVELKWKPGRWTFGAAAFLVGTRTDTDFSYLGMTRNKGYHVVNLLANFRLTSEISLFTAINNVANEQYMEVLGYPSLSRNFRIGLRAGL